MPLIKATFFFRIIKKEEEYRYIEIYRYNKEDQGGQSPLEGFLK